jgi:CBS domain containing-hemolysin-like protein
METAAVFGGMGAWIQLCLWLGWSFVFAGGISAMTTLVRMEAGGLVADQHSLPFPRLLHAPRPALLTLTMAYLVGVSLASAAWLNFLNAQLPSARPWLQVLLWLAYLLLVVLGSVAFKALALTRPVAYYRVFGALHMGVFVVLRPAILLLERLMDRLVPSIWTMDLSPPLSGQEIRGLLADEEVSSHMDSDEVGWARSIFELSDTGISEIMVPRIDMLALDVSTTFEEALPFAANSRFTRLPVYEESPDRILGLLHTKDLLSASVRGETPTIRELLRPAHFLPESKRIDDALAEFREGRIHLAIVVDEYGGTAGIVTLEDILEEIVGEIRDEFDQEGELIRRIDAHRVVIDPRIDLDDFNEELGLDLPTDDHDTLAGWLYQMLGRVPERGDKVEDEGRIFVVDRVEGQRIRQVTLSSESALATRPENGGGGEAAR